MSDKILDLGSVEIMPNTIKAEYYSDLKAEIEKLGEGWEMSVYGISRYLMSMSKEFKIKEQIIGKYGYELISEIEIIADIANRSKTLIIEEDDDIKKFINGEYAIGHDGDGNDYKVNRNSSNVIDYNIEKSIFFVSRNK